MRNKANCTKCGGSLQTYELEDGTHIIPCKCVAPTPDTERLLTDDEIAEAARVCWEALELHERLSFQLVAKAQDLKAHGIDEAESQKKIEGISRDIRSFNDELDHTALGDNEFRRLVTGRWWEALKQREGRRQTNDR